MANFTYNNSILIELSGILEIIDHMWMKQTSCFYKIKNSLNNQDYYHAKDDDGNNYLFSSQELESAKRFAYLRREDITTSIFYGIKDCFNECEKSNAAIELSHKNEEEFLRDKALKNLLFGFAIGVIFDIVICYLYGQI